MGGGPARTLPGERILTGPRWWKRTRGAPASRVAEDVLSEHLDALYRTALRLCNGRTPDAEDLVQEVALQTFRRFHELREIDAARAWLFTILTRTHLNRVRTSMRRRERAVDDLDEASFERALETWRVDDTPETSLERARTRDSIERAIDSLDPALRTVVWLVDVEGFRHREAAAILGVPEGTVASRLFRAHHALRRLLAPAGAGRAGRTGGG